MRKVDLVLVRNYSDNAQDEFTARITAHAQQIVRRGGQVASEQPYVTPFEQYWTFGRLDNQWKLKEVEPPAQGREMVGAGERGRRRLRRATRMVLQASARGVDTISGYRIQIFRMITEM